MSHLQLAYFRCPAACTGIHAQMQTRTLARTLNPENEHFVRSEARPFGKRPWQKTLELPIAVARAHVATYSLQVSHWVPLRICASCGVKRPFVRG